MKGAHGAVYAKTETPPSRTPVTNPFFAVYAETETPPSGTPVTNPFFVTTFAERATTL